MANNGPTFTRLGPGDLPGDSSNRNSPDYVEPEHGLDEASTVVAADLIAGGEVAGMVDTLSESTALLLWLDLNVQLPPWHRTTLGLLDDLCRKMDRDREAVFEKMNAKQEREDA